MTLFTNVFVRKKLPPKPRKCQRPGKQSLTILDVAFNKDRNVEPCTEKMIKLLEATIMMVKGRLWNTARLPHVLESWKRCLLLFQPAMSTLQECFELSSDTPLVVLATERGRQEVRLLMALAPLLHASVK